MFSDFTALVGSPKVECPSTAKNLVYKAPLKKTTAIFHPYGHDVLTVCLAKHSPYSFVKYQLMGTQVFLTI